MPESRPSESHFAPQRRERQGPGDCDICGSRSASAAFPASGLAPDDPPFRVMRCPDCGYGWTDPAPADDEIGRWYPPAYYGRENVRFNPLFEALTRWFRRRRANEVRRRVPPGRVLDVGCGRGLMLGTLKRMGYEPFGVELSDEAAWHARNRMGATVHTGDFLAADFPAESFEAIIFWHSLEHFRRPVEAVLHARKLLKRGGLLVVAVPNSDSLQGRWFGRHWFHLDVPRHYVHFGLRSMEALLLRARFKTETVSHFCFEQNPYGWLQSFYNAMGFEWNLLYSILKNRTARMTSIKEHPFQAVACVALLPIFLPLSIGLTLLEATFRRGGTVEIYSLKE